MLCAMQAFMLSRTSHTFAVACLHAVPGGPTTVESAQASDFFSPSVREACALLAAVHDRHPGAANLSHGASQVLTTLIYCVA